MAITIDSVSKPSPGSVSWSHTVGAGSDRLLVVVTSGDTVSNSGCTYGGEALTLLSQYSAAVPDAAIWYMIAPPSGTNTVVVSWPYSAVASPIAISLAGVDQVSPIRDYGIVHANAGAGEVTKTVTSVSGDLCIGMGSIYVFTGYYLTDKSGQTPQDSLSFGQGGFRTYLSTKESISSSTSMGWDVSVTEAGSTAGVLSVSPSPVTVYGGNSTLPTIFVSSSYTEVPYKDGSCTIPIITLSATSGSSNDSTGGGSIPCITLFSYEVNDSVGDCTSPIFTIASEGVSGSNSVGDIDMPFFSLTSVSYIGEYNQGLCISPIFTLFSEIRNRASLSNPLPMLVLSAFSHGVYESFADLTLPLIDTAGITIFEEYLNKRCFVLNLRNKSLTEYANFNFNSFCTFNGNKLAAGTSGIMILNGSDDAGHSIDIAVDMGNDDFGSPQLKRIHEVYFAGVGSGSHLIEVSSDGDASTGYEFDLDVDTPKTTKIHTGKGRIGRFWNLVVRNISGSDMTLRQLLVNPDIFVKKVR